MISNPPRGTLDRDKNGGLHIGDKTFSVQDQEFFANMSLDVNPMHMDPVSARRVLTGQQVVHGINILIHAIEFWLSHYKLTPTHINCSFNNPINVNELVIFTEVKNSEGEHTIAVSVNGLLCSKIVLKVSAEMTADKDELDTQSLESQGLNSLTENAPLELTPSEHLNKKYLIPINHFDSESQFPLTNQYLHKNYPAALSALSYFVGMICPGMHSIFSSLKVKLNQNLSDSQSLLFSVVKFDNRFGLFDISVNGYFSGELKAFQRPPPFKQETIGELVNHVRTNEFFGTASLIIGGSRGLGELTAKILASGGGKTIITYAQSHNQAKLVSDEINSSNLGACEIVSYDILCDTIESLDIDINSIQMIYFFATPRIFRKKSALFVERLYDEFVNAYVKKLFSICIYLESNLKNKLKMYFPSTIAVENRGNDLTEYAMAKAAAEILIADINKTFKKVSIYSTRLPRLSTDQTSSLFKVETESNISIMLPIVRSMVESVRH